FRRLGELVLPTLAADAGPGRAAGGAALGAGGPPLRAAPGSGPARDLLRSLPVAGHRRLELRALALLLLARRRDPDRPARRRAGAGPAPGGGVPGRVGGRGPAAGDPAGGGDPRARLPGAGGAGGGTPTPAPAGPPCSRRLPGAPRRAAGFFRAPRSR